MKVITIYIFKYLLSFIVPLKEKIYYSKINGLIIIQKNIGSEEMIVDGYIQSGKYAEKLIKYLLSKINFDDHMVKRILVLGIGGGSMLKVLRKSFPLAKIIGVEIDKEMIKAGRKYFGLGQINNCTYYIQDATEFIKKRTVKKFDLIIMDLFIGCDVPISIEKLSSIKNINKLLQSHGIFFINRSYLDKYKKGTITFVQKLKKVFPNVKTYFSKPNLLVITEKQ